MKKDSLKFTILIIVIIALALSFFYFYRGLKSDLEAIITDKNLNIRNDGKYSYIYTATPAPSNTPRPTSESIFTPAIESAYYIQMTPTYNATGSVKVTPDLQSTPAPANSKRIIIYNTHPFEKLESGWDIAEYSKTLADKLNDLGVLSIFLNNGNMLIKDSYLKSRNLVEENMADYSGNIILDIHAIEDFHIPNKEISIWIGKGNLNFEKNREFADGLVAQINDIEPELSCEIIMHDEYVWNQDLSDKAIMIIIGDKSSTEERANQIIDVLSVALENLNCV